LGIRILYEIVGYFKHKIGKEITMSEKNVLLREDLIDIIYQLKMNEYVCEEYEDKLLMALHEYEVIHSNTK
jgi:hypothetical protein